MTNSNLVARPTNSLYQCGHCGGGILLGENEVSGRLYVASGVPICAKCRIMRTISGNRIRADRSKVKTDLHERQKHIEKKEDARVMRLASEIII